MHDLNGVPVKFSQETYRTWKLNAQREINQVEVACHLQLNDPIEKVTICWRK
jgi:hypothetical protein